MAYFKRTKNSGRYFHKIGWAGQHASWKPYPISDQNLWFSLPYFRPDQKFDTPFQTWSTGARCVAGAHDKLGHVLSPNDEEVANSSKKTYPIQDWKAQTIPVLDQNGRNWCPISNQNG